MCCLCVFQCHFSCRNPDEAGVLSKEVLDRLQTGNSKKFGHFGIYRYMSCVLLVRTCKCSRPSHVCYRQCSALDGKCSISCESEVRVCCTPRWMLVVFGVILCELMLTLWPFSQDINCYLIDNNGFILVTEEVSQVSLPLCMKLCA